VFSGQHFATVNAVLERNWKGSEKKVLIEEENLSQESVCLKRKKIAEER
jgi:hypothetical protein